VTHANSRAISCAGPSATPRLMARRMDERAMPVCTAACATVIMLVSASSRWLCGGWCALDG
jgi:hypothetical protein